MEKLPFKTIDQHQDDIIDAFASLCGEREVMLDYLIDLGSALAPMELLYKTDNHLVQGCMSKVWLMEVEKEGLLFFQADSNTAITKGLISLLLKAVSGQSILAIAAAKFYFVEAIGISELIGWQRASGFSHMIKEIKLKALSRLAQSRHA
ncbi:SufE family protein [Candidatus Cardinium hertigii]|uniref:SufE family protein n=1 Tax=Candidatus Cardinium hertigii TaxID=247481 RepID=A0A3N2QBM9_9BACT|nr:SufE family protein [Candidatus Cardinium hertigii]ROT47180.1 SufE family protein [Candidatus Cardinium hertigii]